MWRRSRRQAEGRSRPSIGFPTPPSAAEEWGGERADNARTSLPRAEEVVTGDLETIAAAKDVAAQVNRLGRFDAVIHNAAVGYREPHRLTADGLPEVFAVNTPTS